MGGIFSSSSKKTTNATQSQNQTAQTNPDIPGYIQSPVSDYFGGLSSLMGDLSSPNAGSQYVPGASADQTSAFTGAANLGQASSPYFGSADSAIDSALRSGANLAGSTQVSPASSVASTTVAPASLFNGATVGPAAMMTGATVGPAAQASNTTVAPASLMSADTVSQYIPGELNPYLGLVAQSTLAQNQAQNAQQQAQLEAQGAASGAFGNSRFGLAQSNLQAQQGLNTSSILSGLLNQGFQDAQSAATTDAGNALTAAGKNQDAINTQADLQANLNQQTGLANQSATNTAMLQDAANRQAANEANQAAQNSQSQYQAGLTQNAGLANQAAINAANAQQASISSAAAQQDAAARNAQSQLQAQLSQALQTFNAQQSDNADSRALQAGGLLGNLGTAVNNAANQNVSTQLTAGQDQRTIQAQQAAAKLQLMATLQSLTGVNPASLFGQTSSASANAQSSSTTNQTDTPSLFSDLQSLMSLGSPNSAAGQGAKSIASLFAGS